MFKFRIFFICFILLIFSQFMAFAKNDIKAAQKQTVLQQKLQKPASSDIKQSKPTFVITPNEVNIGTVAFDKSGEGVLTLKNTGSRVVTWTTEGPVGWKNLEKKKLSGSLERTTASLKLGIRLVNKESSHEDKNNDSFEYVEMKLESGEGKIHCIKKISAGMHKEEIIINSSQGKSSVFVHFIIAYTQNNPLINLNPLRLDMGNVLPEKTVSRKIVLNNSGREILTWSVAARKHEKEDMPDDFQQGRYISFVNEETRGGGVYNVSGHLKGTVELTGQWAEHRGYPFATEGENTIRICFSGTGIILYLLNYQKEGDLAMSLDKQPLDYKDLFKGMEDGAGEVLVADKLAYGQHVLTMISKDKNIILEGMKILGVYTSFFPEKSVRVFPDSGATTRQTNYLTVSLSTGQMLPGFYEDDILFNTNGGEAIVKIFAEILPEAISKVVDIYRYYNGSDYLFTADPQSETQRLFQNKYVKEGIAFRLFNPETPGTASFYRWYNPQKKSHFYHYDYAGGKKDLRGYIFEGSIGNIATSKLTNTKELYRWYNPETGHYFYSTDIRGGKIDKNVYKFDGIAGYVK